MRGVPRKKAILYALSLVTLLQVFPAAQAEVCRLKSFHGLESLAAKGQMYVGSDTSDPTKLRLWISATDAGERLYVQSNFVTPGFDYPTKISPRGHASFEQLVENVLYGTAMERDESSDRTSLALAHAVVTVDDAFVKSATLSRLDLGAAHDVRFEDKRAKQITNGSVVWVAETRKNIYIRIGEDAPQASFSSVAEAPFEGSRLKVLSLVKNTTTNAMLQEKLGDRVLQPDVPDLQALQTVFSSLKGGIITIIGHVEGDHFVTRDAAGRELARLGIADVNRAAVAAEVTLIGLGCKSARVKAPVTVATEFNTVDAVRRLAGAVDASTWGEFLERLSADGNHGTELALVIDEESLNALGTTAPTSSSAVRSVGLDVVERSTDVAVSRAEASRGHVHVVGILNGPSAAGTPSMTRESTPVAIPSDQGEGLEQPLVVTAAFLACVMAAAFIMRRLNG